MPLYEEKYKQGECVRVGSLKQLEEFSRTWKYHHPLSKDQMAYAEVSARVNRVSFYHGGDVLYELEAVPGIWHEECLERCAEQER